MGFKITKTMFVGTLDWLRHHVHKTGMLLGIGIENGMCFNTHHDLEGWGGVRGNASRHTICWCL